MLHIMGAGALPCAYTQELLIRKCYANHVLPRSLYFLTVDSVPSKQKRSLLPETQEQTESCAQCIKKKLDHHSLSRASGSFIDGYTWLLPPCFAT